MSDPGPAGQIRNLCDSIHDALTISEHPPSPKGGQGGGAGASRPPMPTAILDAKLDLKQKLTSWALMIGEEAECVIDCDDNSYSIAGWIYTKAEWLAEHPAADDFTAEMEECVRVLRAPYMARADLEYCGEHLGEHVYVRRGQKMATLADGRVEQVKTLKVHNYPKLLEVVGTPQRVAEIIETFYGFPITAKTITTAHSDDHNEERGGSRRLVPAEMVGKRKHYRVSDVLERFGMLTGEPVDRAVI